MVAADGAGAVEAALADAASAGCTGPVSGVGAAGAGGADMPDTRRELATDFRASDRGDCLISSSWGGVEMSTLSTALFMPGVRREIDDGRRKVEGAVDFDISVGLESDAESTRTAGSGAGAGKTTGPPTLMSMRSGFTPEGRRDEDEGHLEEDVGRRDTRRSIGFNVSIDAFGPVST